MVNIEDELLSFLDLLDLDEELIDAPLKYVMGKGNHTRKNLKSAIRLLQYKNLINLREGIECENNDEFDFVVKLLINVSADNVDYVCKIVYIVLCLKPSKIVSKAEHLLQQILSNIEFQSETKLSSSLDNDISIKLLLTLKVSDSILEAVQHHGENLSLLFLETPLERILDFTDEALKVHFLTNTVPKLVNVVIGYNILNRIWDYIQYSKGDSKENALSVLSCLSDYYLPSPDAKGSTKFVSEIIFQCIFWEIILFGINSDDTTLRKISVYLSKRAIDYVITTKKDINVKSMNQTIFDWKNNNSKTLKCMWDNYFILIDSLEEKQCNIVLPSLKLFESITIGDCWLNSAFNMGLKHDNTQVRLKCIEYKLRSTARSHTEAHILLEALNDINIYDQKLNYEVIKIQITEFLKDGPSLMQILKAMPHIKWSPVPFYHLTTILANIDIHISPQYEGNISKIIINLLKIPCNNVVIRKAVLINMIYFAKNFYKNIHCKDIININSIINLEIFLQESNEENPFASLVKQVLLKDEDKMDYFNIMAENYTSVDLIILYLSNHEVDINLFNQIIIEKINKLHEGINRQYSDKKEYLNDVIFLLHFLNKTNNTISNLHDINVLIARQKKIILQYIISLFSSEATWTIEDVIALYEKCNHEFIEEDLGDILLQLYKTSILFLKDNAELDKAVMSLLTLKMLFKNPVMMNKYKHEILNLKRFMEIIINVKFQDSQNESVGKSKNMFYEKACQLIYLYISDDKDDDLSLEDTVYFIENVLECGGYGCLKWILKIVNIIINPLSNEKSNFNMIQFINRVWNEIEELKSNNQYSPCIQEFVELITQDTLLKKSMYNNIVISYCNKIIEYGPVKTNPLYYLIKKLNSKDVKDYGHLIYVLCEILLYCPVPRKDQRITDNLTIEVLQDPKYRINKESIDIHFDHEIQYLSIATLCNINNTETLRMITNFITIRIDNTFKNKQRYHGNSQMHRLLQTALQHILILVLKGGDLGMSLDWCLDLLVKIPHQPSVRISIEWFVSLYFYIQEMELCSGTLQILKSKNVPLTSQFFIMYWLLKHKITKNTYQEKEYNFVLDFLLSHTMGQLFNVRLNAQYLATTLYKLTNKSRKFQYTIDLIDQTFAESINDKNFLKLKTDYFTNDFDIIANLTPYFIYYLFPRYCEIDNNEMVDLDFIKNIMKGINESVSRNLDDNNFIGEWKSCRIPDKEVVEFRIDRGVDRKTTEDSEALGTIQKKYVPWRNMSDVNVYNVGKKKESPSQLIVVASLIDKLPNLGGMARTSEVFGVQTYVVDSLRHMQDKQFQGLSVSAERWINVEEVRPGSPLKEYLMRKKKEGYSVVAAEQTSSSTKLQGFKFPEKTLLLLGHEKEGVPCDLLPIMDHCVEIPQQGYVRSLNVHVTAAIFVWEYARQNVLQHVSG